MGQTLEEIRTRFDSARQQVDIIFVLMREKIELQKKVVVYSKICEMKILFYFYFSS